MKPINEFITESSIRFKTVEDVENYLAQFRDDTTSWKYATDEVRDMARYSREFLQEFDNVKIDAIDFRAIKTPSEWNTIGKRYILDNISKMSKTTQSKFFRHISEFFN
jgi:hypothetical protein